jgi:branched-chain amino acid transport system ATP-binding protein
MTVEENLELGAYIPSARKTARQRMDEVMAIFPILKERRGQLAGKLSGGERQMCAIARALMSHPSLLMLDEPSVGLSPLMAERVLETVAGLVKSEDLTVIIVEQRVTEVLEIADTGHILDHGRIVRSGTGIELLHDRNIQETYMGL